jgi:glutamate synthase domain-containing protein 1
MCGIVGLYCKTDRFEPQLGALLAGMLGTMTDRGPDSAGFAVYGAPDGDVKITLRGADPRQIAKAVTALCADLGLAETVTYRDSHAVLHVAPARVGDVTTHVAQQGGLDLVSVGRSMEIYKEVGLPSKVADRFGLAQMAGTHGIGHTRMATESAVTTRGAHPFTTGEDQCLVHNGSLSNHNALRRQLQYAGLDFVTENDSEVAAGYLTWRMREGAALKEALQQSLDDLDGFFTFVVGTETGFAVLRDPIACKPAVMAETDDYVAFGSEYRALVGLPGIETARLFEPEPATVYAWERH